MTTPPTPTREQIDAALASCQEWFSGMAFGAYQLAHVHILLSAIPALTAELEASRKQLELEENAHHETLDLLEAERKARLDWRGICLAWEAATGHITPESYRASRVEPGVDVIEMLLGEAINAAPSMCYIPRDSIHAVVAVLAEMGAEALPSLEDISEALCPGHRDACDMGMAYESEGRRVAALLKARLAPVLGARRALDAAPAHPTDEQLAEEARRRYPNADSPVGVASQWAYVAGARREGRR